MAEKFKYDFNKKLNWKTTFRLVLLVPLLIVILYVAANIITTGSPTGQLIGAPNNEDDLQKYSANLFDNNVDLEDDSVDVVVNNIPDEIVDNNSDDNTIGLTSSGGGSSGGTSNTPVDDAPKDEEPADDGCNEFPKTETLISDDGSSRPVIPAEFWGVVTIGSVSIEDYVDVTASMNGVLISKTTTCNGYYRISVPKVNGSYGNEIIIKIEEQVQNFNWSSGIYRKDFNF